jgi:hypothetical protein
VPYYRRQDGTPVYVSDERAEQLGLTSANRPVSVSKPAPAPAPRRVPLGFNPRATVEQVQVAA